MRQDQTFLLFSDHDRTQTMRLTEPFTALSPVWLHAIRRNVLS